MRENDPGKRFPSVARKLTRRQWIGGALSVATLAALAEMMRSSRAAVPADRKAVIFWHFWGGAEQQVVQAVVRRFNASQDRHWVVETAIPGQNLDMKFFMSVAGGSVPDVVNQDDQVIAGWASRGVLNRVRDLTADDREYRQLLDWLSPPAKRIGTCDGELFAICNALDIRAMFYRRSALEDATAPTTLAQFDRIARRKSGRPNSIPFLPDDRRLWAWAIAFGGRFYEESEGDITTDAPENVAALRWMRSYSEFHGLPKVLAFRSTNREAGAGSMLLDGRYEMMMDGQWRVAELDAAGLDYEVGPLPHPPGGRERAGWVNGNFFLVPAQAANPAGAWAFMKFWTGFDGFETEAAETAVAGGWIPASPAVIATPTFQSYLRAHPKFRLFVELAQSENQIPTPPIPVQAYYFDRINRAAEEALTLQVSAERALQEAAEDVIAQLEAASRFLDRRQAWIRTER